MKSPVSGRRIHVIGVTASGYKRTGLMCYHRRAASFWQWQNKRHSLRTHLLRHGPGLMRCTQSGIGGASAFVCVTTVVEFVRDDGGPARVQGEFAGFPDPTATDLSVLGRGVLDHFDLIVSRRQNEIFLLTPRHQYRIERDG